MRSKADILAQQRAWAQQLDLHVDAQGYLPDWTMNLRERQLSKRALHAFSKASGSELNDAARRPAKMRALHSSAALAVNVFDHWTERDAAPLLASLGIEGDATCISFERKYPTWLDGTPPNVDVAMSSTADSS